MALTDETEVNPEPQQIYVSIGNSDDKLSQYDWAIFQQRLVHVVKSYSKRIYGVWYSAPTEPWQNMCISFAMPLGGAVFVLQDQLRGLAGAYGQDSIAWSETKTTMLTSGRKKPW